MKTVLVWTGALRLQHWIKSGFCLAALFFHGAALDASAWAAVLPVVLCFSLVSSSGYLVNDLVNRAEDRKHPRKRTRPIASGAIVPGHAWAAVAVLAVAAFGLLYAFYGFGPTFYVVGCYYLFSWLYSFVLRGLPLLDVLCLALGFVARVAAGALALQSYDDTAYPTLWLLSCTYFLALLLGFGKRKGEWLLLHEVHKKVGETRRALRGYTSELLDVLTGCSALLAGGTYLAYCLDRPDRIPFIFTGIPAMVGLMSYLRLALRSSVVETPENLFFRSPGLVVSVLAWIGMVAIFTAMA